MQFALHDLLREIVATETVEALAQAMVDRIADSRSVLLARLWITSAHGLVLVAGAGTPSGGGAYNRLDGEFREMGVADSKMAEIADGRQPFVVRGLRGDEDWLINPAWVARQGVRAFLALPLIKSTTTVGALAIFDRETPTDRLVSELHLIADMAAARIGDLRRAVAPPSLSNQAVPPKRIEEGPRGLGATAIVTRAELRRVEKANLEAALAATGGKIFGADGAAVLLGMRPTTLASRIKALGVSRGVVSAD